MANTNLDTDNNEDSVTPREHAEWLVGYFEHVTNESGLDVWKYGLKTAREWLRLIDSDSISTAEVSALVGVVHANRYRTSGWSDLAFGVYHWASISGFPIPPPEEFWISEGLPGVKPEDKGKQMSPSMYAEMLVKHFEQYTYEDPNQALWRHGLDTTKRWLSLITSDSISESEVSVLIEAIYKNRPWTSGYFSLALGVYYWSQIKGFSDLWPKKFRLMIDKS